MKIQDLINKSPKEIEDEILELKKSLFGLRIQFASQQMNNSSQFKKIRKDIARAKTVLNQKIKAK